MDLLNVLLSSLTSNQSLGALSSNTGVNQDKLKKILIIAIPLLIKYMTSNASSESGLSSLFGALGQHQSKSSVKAQIDAADAEDGSKIIGHILGDDKEKVVQSIAKESGVDTDDVAQVLGNVAPSVMSGVSAATTSAHKQKKAGVDLSDGLDLGDLMAMFGGAAASAQPQANSASNGSQLINALLSMM